MSIENSLAILFLALLSWLLYSHRKKLVIQPILGPFLYFALWKTKLGLKQMDSISKRFPKLINFLGIAGVYVGVLGMIFIAFLLIKNFADLFLLPGAAAGVALVLPFKVQGGFYVPFFYWIISIFAIAVLHEFSHGVVARRYNVPVKSSGFAFLGILVPIIPAAFVEPEEKALSKKKRMQKLAVFAAGPFSNIVSAFIYLGIFLLLAVPVASNVIDFNGVKIEGFSDNSSAELSGLIEGTVIQSIDGQKIQFVNNLSDVLQQKQIGDVVLVKTIDDSIDVKLTEHPRNSSSPYMGVLVSQSQTNKPEFVAKYGNFTASALIWILGLFTWLYLLSLGIGLFNLVPVGPIDGGQMSRELFRAIFKKEATAHKVWKYTSLFFFAIIMINIFVGFF